MNLDIRELDAGEFALPVKAEDHSEQAVELSALHALTEDEDVLGQQLLVLHLRQIEIAAQVAGVAGDELILPHDRRNLLEHRLALMRIDPQAGDHVEQAVRVDVLLVRVAAEHHLQLRRRDELADHVLDVVAHDPLRGGKVADAHHDDPAFVRGDLGRAPLFHILLHLDVLRLPVVGHHGAVFLQRPWILQWQQVKTARRRAIDHPLPREGRSGDGLVQDKGVTVDFRASGHAGERAGQGRGRM